MYDFFFLVSGENLTLPCAEIKAILASEGVKFHVLEERPQILRISADKESIEKVKLRSAMLKVCGLELYNCGADINAIISCANETDFARFISEKETFAVRIIRIEGSARQISRTYLEGRIGEIILKKVEGAKVDLTAPQKIFFGILASDRFIFGLKLADVKPKSFEERCPKRRLFTHATTMPPKLARCMVNLAQPRPGSLILDPFCGTGSILIEAGLIGCQVLGFDVKRYMVRGCGKNLTSFGIKPNGLCVSDARLIPLRNETVDCIVTDPPYGTASSTIGLTLREVLDRFFASASRVIRKGGRICLAAPKTINVKMIGEKSGFTLLESHLIHVHRRLTREIAVFQLTN
ncbi:MAG: TRM11 family methyltransferase [Nitrososphaerota archaeon]|nr:TRM11 family methyltransferase [Candidatus Bathyarchaeota archaeon]MDW8048539.1 TRM11 family methyltransferase [Nitrososphaerota archaeon]